VPLIFAAASLSDVLTESAGIYERDTGKRVEFSFGGSIALANQIATLGAPADGVFFVGEEAADLISGLPGQTSGYDPHLISNSLVVIGAPDSPPVSSLAELAETRFRIAIGDPQLAPAGRYAMEALENAGVAGEVSEQLIFAVDVRAAMAAVESGNAGYGIVYKTDAVTSESANIVFEVDSGYSRITYIASLIDSAQNGRGAQEFLNFVVIEPETRKVFEDAGFELMGVGRAPAR
jgi:molybdate transport system substrate-binding protein